MKLHKIILPAGAALILLLSFQQILFLTQLVRYSFISPFDVRTRSMYIINNMGVNERTHTLIEKYRKNPIFLSVAGGKIIRELNTSGPKSEVHQFLPAVIKKFPENIFLEHHKLYSAPGSNQDWRNFDLLFFQILKDKEMNQISFLILCDSIDRQEIPNMSLPHIILFLNWQENFILSNLLLSKLAKDNLIPSIQHMALKEDMKQRVNPGEKLGISSSPVRISSSLRKHFQDSIADITLGENLIPGGMPRSRKSLYKLWYFSDQSDHTQFSKGSFVGDLDSYENRCMRVMGFFTNNTKNKIPCRGGFWLINQIPLEKTTYLFHFKYKTSQDHAQPTFWLTPRYDQDRQLAPTGAGWKEVYYIFNNETLDIPRIKPLLRMYGVGSVWFDNVYLSSISIQGMIIDNDLLIVH